MLVLDNVMFKVNKKQSNKLHQHFWDTESVRKCVFTFIVILSLT